MSLRVLAITSWTSPWVSVRPEAEMLIALAGQGARVTVMTQGDAPYAERVRQAGLGVIDYHPRAKFSIEAIRRIRTELKRGGYDVVYCFNNKAIANAAWASLGLPVRLVTYRGSTVRISRWDPACYLTHLHPRVDGIICVADAVRAGLLRASRLGERRIITVYKGHEPEWYAGTTAADLTQFGIPAGAPVVVSVANIRPRKGLPVLIEAFRRLPDDRWHLLLIGKGTDGTQVQRLIRAGPAAGRIHVAGFREDVLSLVAACRISVLSTIKGEGLPKTVIEAMALGLPVIVTSTGGSRELVVDGETGHIVAPGDPDALAAALASMGADEEHCRAMGRAARDYLFRRFTARQAGKQTLAFLESLCESPRSA